MEDKNIFSENMNSDTVDQAENLQLAENEDIEPTQKEAVEDEFEEKRQWLEKTKIVKQTWSISEIYQKIKDKKLLLDPDYQRNAIWDSGKKTAFIESLYMGIMIPPLYVVEVPSEDILEENKYEVVDGKQRLSAIMDYVTGQIKLQEKSLEYYGDLFGGKTFAEIKNIQSEKTTQMLSSVLDIYVITSNSPEFTKYDIFARLNKGATPLRVNEIRRAIYKSHITDWISDFITNELETNLEEYRQIFSKNDIKHYDDYGRFYRSVSFFVRSNIESKLVEKYNSRPREMINGVLQGFQKKEITNLDFETLQLIMRTTIDLKKQLKGVSNADYIIDSCIPFVSYNIFDKIDAICKDTEIISTLEKSPSTTSNVNKRFARAVEIVLGNSNG